MLSRKVPLSPDFNASLAIQQSAIILINVCEVALNVSGTRFQIFALKNGRDEIESTWRKTLCSDINIRLPSVYAIVDLLNTKQSISYIRN